MTEWQWKVIQALITIVLSMTGFVAMESDKLNDCVEVLREASVRDKDAKYIGD